MWHIDAIVVLVQRLYLQHQSDVNVEVVFSVILILMDAVLPEISPIDYELFWVTVHYASELAVPPLYRTNGRFLQDHRMTLAFLTRSITLHFQKKNYSVPFQLEWILYVQVKRANSVLFGFDPKWLWGYTYADPVILQHKDHLQDKFKKSLVMTLSL